MGLRDIQIHRTTVMYRETEISVRGISASDLFAVAQDYGPNIAILFGKVTAGEIDSNIKKHMALVMSEAPDLVGAIIALATDDYHPKSIEVAKQLPGNVQIELVEAIFNETFYSEAEIKKLIESLTRMIAAASGVLKDMPQSVLPSGIGASEGKSAH